MEERKELTMKDNRQTAQDTALRWTETCANCAHFNRWDSACSRTGITIDQPYTVLCWNETCSDCRYFNPGDSTCGRTGIEVDPNRAKCCYFY